MDDSVAVPHQPLDFQVPDYSAVASIQWRCIISYSRQLGWAGSGEPKESAAATAPSFSPLVHSRWYELYRTSSEAGEKSFYYICTTWKLVEVLLLESHQPERFIHSFQGINGKPFINYQSNTLFNEIITTQKCIFSPNFEFVSWFQEDPNERFRFV